MPFAFWKSLRRNPVRQPRSNRRGATSQVRFRPQIEFLEDRLAPATFNVTTFSDVLGGTNGGPNYSLRQAILDADNTSGANTINLPAGTYNLTLFGNTQDGKTGALFIANNSLTINGLGTTVINAQGIADRAFVIDSGVPVTLSGIAITGGDATSNSFGGALGGAIWTPFSATINLNSVFISNNHADGSGGGVYMSNGTLNISGGAINGNSAGQHGGGICFLSSTGNLTIGAPNSQTGSPTVIGTSVSNNRAALGGGIYVVSGTNNGNYTLFMEYDNILSNTATTAGGGMYALVYDAAIYSSKFSQNNGGSSGGGIYLATSADSPLYGCVISNNQASNSGSGIRWSVNADSGQGNTGIFDSDITGNSGPNGGPGGSGVSAHVNGTSADFGIGNCTITGNVATGTGGGVYAVANATGSTIKLDDDTIANNSATANGGGVGCIVSSGVIEILACTVQSNSANSGGGVYSSGSSLVTSTIIAKNSAGSRPDVSGSFTDGGNNLIGVNNGSFGNPSTLSGSLASPLNPLTGPAEENGQLQNQNFRPGFYYSSVLGDAGFTANLLPGSPAIGGSTATSTFPLDERLFTRPGQGLSNPCIGAFEYQVPTQGGQHAAYVENIYETLLNRTADPAGLAAWTGFLDGGASATTFIQDFLNNPEPRQDLVTTLYYQYLHRAPDPAGLAGWVSLLASGGTIEQVILGFIGSPEFYATSGGTNQSFVQALYEDVLGRFAEPTGFQGWVQGMNGGLSTIQVANGFVGSAEYHNDVVTNYYQECVGRTPQPAEVSPYANALASGVFDQTVLAAILGSPEAVTDRS